jgi:membrane protease YdiL (CAAX protease family)|tara:strand:- start:559 stop:1305 length:747 start_codon:yes stop_codon:yes gene_type:complete
VQIPGVIDPGNRYRQIDVPWSIRDVLLASGAVVSVVIVTMVVASLLLRLASVDDDWLSEGNFLGFPAPLALAVLLEAFFLGAVYFYAGVKRAATIQQLGFLPPEGNRPYLLALGAWMVGIVILIAWGLITEIIGIDLFKIPAPASELVDYSGIQLMFSIIVIGLFGPFCEEIFFRGFALPVFARRYGLWGGILISAALFSAFHFSIGALVPIFIFGIVLAWLYVRTGSIYPSMVAHAVQNIVATLLVN